MMRKDFVCSLIALAMFSVGTANAQEKKAEPAKPAPAKPAAKPAAAKPQAAKPAAPKANTYGFKFKRLTKPDGKPRVGDAMEVTDEKTGIAFDLVGAKPKRGVVCKLTPYKNGKQVEAPEDGENGECKTAVYKFPDGDVQLVATDIKPGGIGYEPLSKLNEAEVSCVRNQVNVFLAAREKDASYAEVIKKRRPHSFRVVIVDATMIDPKSGIKAEEVKPLAKYTPDLEEKETDNYSQIRISLTPSDDPKAPKCVITEDQHQFEESFDKWRKKDGAGNGLLAPSDKKDKKEDKAEDLPPLPDPNAAAKVDPDHSAEKEPDDSNDPFSGVPSLDGAEIRGSVNE